MNVQQHISTLVDRQHRHPTGIVGRLVGERMVRQHAIETEWTLSQLAITPADRVLELGFGAGRALELAATQASQGHVVGIDVSATMVHAARRRNARAFRRRRVTLLQGDATSLPFADQQFDKIFSIHTFYFWPDALRTLEGILRVLRPHGMLALTLSTGVISPGGERESGQFGSLQAFLEEEVVPGMRRLGFMTAAITQGPDNRQYNSVAVIGRT